MRFKLLSLTLTLSLVGVLLLIGPASAINLNIKNLASSYSEDGEARFTAAVDMEEGEHIHEGSYVQARVLNSTGAPVDTCNVSMDGSPDCTSGLSLASATINGVYENTSFYGYGYGYGYSGSLSPGYTMNITTPGYGYGYAPGYGYSTYPHGEMSFNFTWQTPSLSSDRDYQVEFFLKRTAGENNSYTFGLNSNPTFTVTDSSSADTGDDSSTDKGGGAPLIRRAPDEETNATAPTEGISTLVRQATLGKNLSRNLTKQIDTIVDTYLRNLEPTNLQVRTGADAAQASKEEIELLGREKGLDPWNVAFTASTNKTDTIAQSDLSATTKDEIKKQLGNPITAARDIQRTIRASTITDNDGNTYGVVTMNYAVSKGNYIVNIPKTVAESAHQLGGTFEVLRADPVILFTDTNRMKFFVASDPENLKEVTSEDIRIAATGESVPDKEDSAENTTPNPLTGNAVGESKPFFSGSTALLIVLVFLGIVVSVAIILKKRAAHE